MPEKPQSLNEILSEERLCEWLGLPINQETGHSVQLTYWIKDGLNHVDVQSRRLFFEKDVIEYIFNKSQT
ncbi:MAG: hypothetical protein JRF35_01870 [Deltaproteobacteria bacterium]|nr:hypothetical protein [Deltaproteobacteria bacterium]MBW2309809.1 hypothetical protein [Deltaproteobacteria bacterium]